MKILSLGFSGTVVTVGAAVLAIGVIDFGGPNMPDLVAAIFYGYSEKLINIGVATIFVGIVIFSTYLLSKLVSPLSDKVIGVLSRRTTEYVAYTGGIRDLSELYGHYKSLFGTDIVPMTQMASWLAKNKSILTKVLKVGKTKVEPEPMLLGFFDIEPLTSSGENKMRSPTGSAKRLNKADIHSGKVDRPYAYYVGSIGCPIDASNFSKGICMVFFISEIKKLSNGETINVYARPVTDAGVYLAKCLFRMTKRTDGPDKEVTKKIMRTGMLRNKTCHACPRNITDRTRYTGLY